ncbi:MAG TPA: T9SS type A sorting domain-containing protein [Candidatus Kapabacteria bacterium]|nr:T9SS type A sorting domain-containing protein [Candidatus Kapabacteria bacterium]
MTLLPLARRFAPVVIVAGIALAALSPARAQESKDFAVMLRADVAKAPRPTITLHWNRDAYTTSYGIWRKAPTDADWPQTPRVTLDSTATSWTDTAVAVGAAYEYQVIRQAYHKLTDTTGLRYYGSGYILSGIERLPQPLPGRVLLLVDSTMVNQISAGLKKLESDLIREGWLVTRRVVPRTETFDGSAVKAVKAIIMAEESKPPRNLRSVFIIGRVAVPYSGDINPDGHPDHLGAWPADLYYGDIDGDPTWTDTQVNDAGAGRAENRNVPGDGKFDQSDMPSTVKLAVGRVDFYNMPAFTATEAELLNRYLAKDDAFRTGATPVKMGGVVDDNFGATGYPEAFASAGWRTIPLFGGENTTTDGDFFTTLGGDTTYLWAYGCGGGTYTSAGGIGSTTDFATRPAVRGVFTMLFGSYFGDWDAQNNFMRASLCSAPSTLTCVWDARPQWYFHHMALGETIGYSTILSQNNSNGVYIPNVYFTQQYPNGVLYTFGNGLVHAALLGDPTLRALMGHLPSLDAMGLTPTADGKGVRIFWQPSPAVQPDGYFIYWASSTDGVYHLLNNAAITATEYVDSTLRADSVIYLVRPAILRTTASGTYYDASAGVNGGVRVAGVADAAAPAFACSAAPNPATRSTVVSATLPAASHVAIDVHDIAGRRVRRLADGVWEAGTSTAVWDLRDAGGSRVPPGVYILRVTAGERINTVKVVVAP